MTVVLYPYQAAVLYQSAIETARKADPVDPQAAEQRFRERFPDAKSYCDWLDYVITEKADAE